MTNDELNETITPIEGFKNQFLAGWSAIKRVTNEEIPEPADIGFLMEIMGDISPQVKDTTSTHKVKLTIKKWMGIGHCLNICLNNDMHGGDAQKMFMCEMLSKISDAVENAEMMTQDPEKLKTTLRIAPKTAGGLTLVQGGSD